MPSISCRRVHTGGRPDLMPRGNSGSSRAHWPFVRSPRPAGHDHLSRDPRSRPMVKADAHQPTVGPVFEPSRPDGAGVVGLVEIRHDLRQHGLTFSWVGDRRGPCRQIRMDPVLEVEGEVGIGEKVRMPVGRGTAGAAAQVSGARSSVEEDLDAVCSAGAAPHRRDVDDPFSGARGGGDLDGSCDVVGQVGLRRAPCGVVRPGRVWSAHAVSA